MGASNRFADPLLRRYARAEAKRRMWDGILHETYRLALPNQDDDGNRTPGAKRDAEIFDGTAIRAVKWKRAKLHGDLFPPFRHWTHFLPDSLDADEFDDDGARAWSAFVETAEKKFHKAIDRSNFHLEVPLALGDALISTGAVLIQEGTPEDPLRFEAVPISQVIPEESADGTIRTVFRGFDAPGRDISERWPDAKIPADVAKRIADEPDQPVKLVEATVWNPERRVYDYAVFLPEGEHRLVARVYRTSPWVVFRMDKATGETMGRGPVLDARADIATANKTKELILKNASIAVTGIWQAEDDGVLNPANIKLIPGTIIPKAVGSAGLQPLTSPGRFDTSQLVLDDLRGRIRHALLGDKLGRAESAAATATATEVLQRADDMARLLGATYGRLQSELLTPLVLRALRILRRRGEIPDLLIDGRTVDLQYRSPLAQNQGRRDARNVLSWLGALAGLGPAALSTVDAAAAARWLARAFNVPTELLAPLSAQGGVEAAGDFAPDVQGLNTLIDGLGDGAARPKGGLHGLS